MNRHDVLLLQDMRGYPAVSLLIPMHRTIPGNKQDPIRVKNLVTEAKKRLSQEFSNREVGPVLSNLDEVVAQIDYPHALDGLALFANQQGAYAFVLPFQPQERVVVDETFATRDLVMALNHLQRYWILTLSERPTRLYEGAGETLTEVCREGFPMQYVVPGSEPGELDRARTVHPDEQRRQFFRQVDEALGKIISDDPLPMIVTGVERHLGLFQQVSKHTASIVATLKGSYEKASPHELAQQVWPLFREYQDRQRQQTLAELDAAVSAQRYVSTIGEVWRMAHEGRGSVLIVEENFHYPARVDQTGTILSPASDTTAPDVIDDAVDEVIEAVIEKGGEARFVDDGALTQHQHIALILRY